MAARAAGWVPDPHETVSVTADAPEETLEDLVGGFDLSGGGLSNQPLITAKNASIVGPNQTVIDSMLKQLRELLGTDPDCLKFLNGTSGMNVLTDVIGSHLDVFPTIGHADLFLNGDPNALGAISGAGELQAGFSILVNNSGAFFGASLSAAGFQGGTPAARGEILLHEFGHVTNALNPDLGKPKVGRENDEKVKKNCKKTLNTLKKRK